MMKLIVSIFFYCLFFNCIAQPTEFKYEDYSYSDQIKSVKLVQLGKPISLPLVELGSGSRIKLSFDDMAGGNPDIAYRIIHCDKDWNPSDLLDIEYIEGFNDDYLDTYTHSNALYSEYTHYELILPNEDLGWTISGNYILLVYDVDNNEALLTRRFIVFEDQVKVQYRFVKPIDVMDINFKHAMELQIYNDRLNISRPTTEIYATVIQNGVWHNAIQNIQPKFIRGKFIHFNDFNRINFPALKEFRFFDSRSLDYTGINTHSVEITPEGTYILLDMDDVRYDKNYLFAYDANGQFYIDVHDNIRAQSGIFIGGVSLNDLLFVQNRTLSNSLYGGTEFQSGRSDLVSYNNTILENPYVESFAEYTNVIFTLDQKYELKNKRVFVLGAFSDWNAYDEYEMFYDEERRIYFGEAIFKQGYYNYIYGIQNEDGSFDFEPLEGNWYETENNYTAIVYFSEFGSQYDRVIGLSSFNSNPY